MALAPQFILSPNMMRSLDPEAIARLLGPLVEPADLSDEPTMLRLFARVVWNTVVEPGDGDAGRLVSVLGPESCFALGDGQTESVAYALALLGVEDLDLSKALGRWGPRFDLDRVAGLCKSAANIGLRFVSPEAAAWPSQLNDLGAHAPQGLWLRGGADALARSARSIAIVGSRASTQYGDRVAGDLAVELSMRDLTVVSGGAYGIDAAAHRAALADVGNTIAILAGGGDRLYPSGNRSLLERISEEGAIITEAPVGQPPTRWRFLQRNRLIAALSQTTVVVEAGARSGALNTANHAMHLGRPLGAVPGPVTSASSVGCHRLLKEQQARLISQSSDVFELWQEGSAQLSALYQSDGGNSDGGNREHSSSETVHQALLELEDIPGASAPSLSSIATRVRDALRPRKRQNVAEIALECGMSAREVRVGLTELQIAGLAEDNEAGWRKSDGRSMF